LTAWKDKHFLLKSLHKNFFILIFEISKQLSNGKF
jgi:hypothetical protein